MAEHAGGDRAAWLEQRLPEVYRDLADGEAMADIAKREATMTPPEKAEFKSLIKDLSDLDFGQEGEGGSQ